MTLNINPSWRLGKIECRHSPLLPKNIRGVVVGTSGSGKSNRVFNMKLQPDFLDYNSFHIYSPSIYQNEYEFLVSGFKNRLSKEDMVVCLNSQEKLGITDPEKLAELYSNSVPENEKWQNTEIITYKNASYIPQPESLHKGRKHLLLFDDCMSGSQKTLENFYTRGRHNACNCLYITQSWFEIPRGTFRSNDIFLLLYPLSGRDLKQIYNDFSPELEPCMTMTEFCKFCQMCWAKPYGYVSVDRFNSDVKQRVRKGLDNS